MLCAAQQRAFRLVFPQRVLILLLTALSSHCTSLEPRAKRDVYFDRNEVRRKRNSIVVKLVSPQTQICVNCSRVPGNTWKDYAYPKRKRPSSGFTEVNKLLVKTRYLRTSAVSEQQLLTTVGTIREERIAFGPVLEKTDGENLQEFRFCPSSVL